MSGMVRIVKCRLVVHAFNPYDFCSFYSETVSFYECLQRYIHAGRSSSL